MEHLRKIWRNPIENFRAWHYWKVSDVWHNPFCPFLLSLLFFLFSEWWLKSIECRVYAGEPNWKKKEKEKRKWRSMERERWSKGFEYWERSFCCSLGFMNHQHEIIKMKNAILFDLIRIFPCILFWIVPGSHLWRVSRAQENLILWNSEMGFWAHPKQVGPCQIWEYGPL